MRILFVVPYEPNLVRVRPFQLIRGLARRGHSLTLATVSVNAADRIALPDLISSGVHVVDWRVPTWRSVLNCIRALPRREPLQSVYSFCRGGMMRIEELIRDSNFDAIHVEHMRGSQYGLKTKRFLQLDKSPHVPVIWDSVDCISLLFRQARSHSSWSPGGLVRRFEQDRTEHFEGWLLGQFDRVLVTSKKDADALVKLAQLHGNEPPQKPFVLRNGVDLDYFTPGADERDRCTVVMSGKMSYHANVSAARYLVKTIMPIVWRNRPDARVVIVGKSPTRRVRALQESSSVRPGSVTVTGEVEDIRPHLMRASVAVAPLRYGAGIQNKVLEAMACGTPVVATPIATTALDVEDGRELLVGSTPQAFAQKVTAMLNDLEGRERIGRAGRAYVDSHHCWDKVTSQLESVYEEAMASTPSDA